MSDFRKDMHIAYKKKLASIIFKYINELGETDMDFNEYISYPKLHIEKWVDASCLPMGDFSKEDALKEIEEWQK